MPAIYHEPIPVTCSGAAWFALGHVLTHPAVREAIADSDILTPEGQAEFQTVLAAMSRALARAAGIADPFAN